MRAYITHLRLAERQRQLSAMRSAQLGLSMSDYIGWLIDKDSHQSGLVEFLDSGEDAITSTRTKGKRKKAERTES